MIRKVTLEALENPGWVSAVAVLVAVIFFGYCVGNAVAAILGEAFK